MNMPLNYWRLNQTQAGVTFGRQPGFGACDVEKMEANVCKKFKALAGSCAEGCDFCSCHLHCSYKSRGRHFSPSFFPQTGDVWVLSMAYSPRKSNGRRLVGAEPSKMHLDLQQQ